MFDDPPHSRFSETARLKELPCQGRQGHKTALPSRVGRVGCPQRLLWPKRLHSGHILQGSPIMDLGRVWTCSFSCPPSALRTSRLLTPASEPGFMHKVKSLKTGDLLPNTNSTVSCCVITSKPFKSSEPQFLLSTYLSIHPSSTFIYHSRLW